MVDFKKGFHPLHTAGAGPIGVTRAYICSNTNANALGQGDALTLNRTSGLVERHNGTTNITLGVASGFAYVNTDNEPVYSNYLPASTSIPGGYRVEGGYQNPVAYVIDNPQQLYAIQSDTTVTGVADGVGLYFDLSVADADSQTKQSAMRVTGAGVATSVSAVNVDHAVQMLGLHALPGNDYGVAEPVLVVKFVNTVLGGLAGNSG